MIYENDPKDNPDSKLRWPHVGPTWILLAPRWANVGPTRRTFWAISRSTVNKSCHSSCVFCIDRNKHNWNTIKEIICNFLNKIIVILIALMPVQSSDREKYWQQRQVTIHKTRSTNSLISGCSVCIIVSRTLAITCDPEYTRHMSWIMTCYFDIKILLSHLSQHMILSAIRHVITSYMQVAGYINVANVFHYNQHLSLPYRLQKKLGHPYHYPGVLYAIHQLIDLCPYWNN